jgi:maltose O-acetyltransferase
MLFGSLHTKLMDAAPGLSALGQRLAREVHTLEGALPVRLALFAGVADRLPNYALTGIRARLLRQAGLRVGPRTAIQGHLSFVGRPKDISRISIGEDCIVAPGVSIGLDAPVIIGNRVALGPNVTLCTATHGLGFGSRRMNLATEARPVTIGDGAWICMSALILPGINVGAGAIVGAQSVVVEDVPPHTLVVGNPATVREELPFRQR